LRVLLAASAGVEHHDIEHEHIVVPEDEQVSCPKVVGTGELPPSTAEIHGIIVDDEFNVPQRHGASTGEPHLQVLTSPEHPRGLERQPLRGGRSEQEFLSYLEPNQFQNAEKALNMLFLVIPGRRIVENSKLIATYDPSLIGTYAPSNNYELYITFFLWRQTLIGTYALSR
jgi:hypothetical protein